MQITAYEITENALPLVPGRRERQWMDDTVYSYAYRCLPLSIANSHGWDFLSPCDFMIEWDGGDRKEGLTFEAENTRFLSSVFGYGVLTIHTETLIQTDQGWNTFVMGSPNFTVPWAYALSGVVETWWLPFTFTLNWKLHRPGTFWFKKGDPLGFIFPVPAEYDIEARKMKIGDNPELQAKLRTWSKSRNDINNHSDIAFKYQQKSGPVDPSIPSTHWEKNYMQGVDKEGNKIAGHKTKLKFPEFRKST